MSSMSVWMRRCVRKEPGEGTAAAGTGAGNVADSAGNVADSAEPTTAPGTHDLPIPDDR